MPTTFNTCFNLDFVKRDSRFVANFSESASNH